MVSSELTAAWDAAIADYQANKGTVVEVCRAHKLPPASFYYQRDKRSGGRKEAFKHYNAKYRAKKKAEREESQGIATIAQKALPNDVSEVTRLRKMCAAYRILLGLPEE